MRRSGAEGPVGRAIGSVLHVGMQGQEDMHVELQSQMVAADVNCFRVLQGQWAGRWALRCMWDCRDRKVCMWNCSHKWWRQRLIFFWVLKVQWAGRWALHCMWDCRDRKVYMWNCSHECIFPRCLDLRSRRRKTTMVDLFLRCSDLRSRRR